VGSGDEREKPSGLKEPEAANCVLDRSSCSRQYSRANNPVFTCTWTCERFCSRIRAWLRLHPCFVSTVINDLHPFGLREDEISPVAAPMDNMLQRLGLQSVRVVLHGSRHRLPYVQQVVICSWNVMRRIAASCKTVDALQDSTQEHGKAF
jgi:hypothetical protein